MPASVAFNNIPGNLQVPFFYAEINSGGTPYSGDPKLLLVGLKTSAGVAVAGVPYGPLANEQDVIAQAGKGSMLHAMYNLARRNAPFQPVWILPLADPAGAAAAGSISINAGNPVGVTGAAVLRVMGRDVVVQVNSADTAATTALAIRDAINALNLPVTAAIDGTSSFKVNLTARHIGALGNKINVVIKSGDNVLSSTNCTIVAMTGGTGVPALDTALANLGDDEFDWIAGPYGDATSLNSTGNFLNDTSGRWSAMQQLYGHYTTTVFDTLANLVTLGASRNDQHATIVGNVASPTPPWEWTAAIGAREVDHLGTAPELSRPLQNLELVGVLPADDRSTWWDITDRQALYSNGIAACRVTKDGKVVIDRLVTTYQKNAAGVPDKTFMDTETMAQVMFVTRYLKSAVANKHSRQALADENPDNVAGVTTADDIRNTIVHAYADLVALGVCENLDLFVKNLVVARDASNANRVNAYVPVDVVNQLRIVAVNETVFLQFQTPSDQAQVA